MRGGALTEGRGRTGRVRVDGGGGGARLNAASHCAKSRMPRPCRRARLTRGSGTEPMPALCALGAPAVQTTGRGAHRLRMEAAAGARPPSAADPERVHYVLEPPAPHADGWRERSGAGPGTAAARLTASVLPRAFSAGARLPHGRAAVAADGPRVPCGRTQGRYAAPHRAAIGRAAGESRTVVVWRDGRGRRWCDFGGERRS